MSNYSQLFIKGFDEIARDATISDNLLYRYELRRWWDDDKPLALFWALNPSTADSAVDDPTIRRCMSFARREGCGGIIVVNWFALRATDPKELYGEIPPIGPENDRHIRAAIESCQGPLIASWGAHSFVDHRLKELPDLLGGRKLQCLGKTRNGSPRHPLYVRADAPLIDY